MQHLQKTIQSQHEHHPPVCVLWESDSTDTWAWQCWGVCWCEGCGEHPILPGPHGKPHHIWTTSRRVEGTSTNWRLSPQSLQRSAFPLCSQGGWQGKLSMSTDWSQPVVGQWKVCYPSQICHWPQNEDNTRGPGGNEDLWLCWDTGIC